MEGIKEIFESHSEKEQKIFEKIATEIFEETKKESILMQIHKSDNVSLFKSKYAWLPFFPKDMNIPEKEWKQLFFILQINCEELPENDLYPKKWILQFWIDNFTNEYIPNDSEFVYQDDNSLKELNIHNDFFKVFYFEKLENACDMDEICKKYKYAYEKFDFINPWYITFEKKVLWIDILHKKYAQRKLQKIEKYFDMATIWIENEIDNIYENIWISKNSYCWGKILRISWNRIIWYLDSFWIDFDEKYELLLSFPWMEVLDADINNYSIGIIWFFIDKNDLKKQDFSKTLCFVYS